MKLTCIACMRREEIKARTRVDWYYMPQKENDVPPNKTHVGPSLRPMRPLCWPRFTPRPPPPFQIYRFENYNHTELDGPFKGRLSWNGSQDLQDLSLRILNVTYNDSGVYECHVFRRFEFNFFAPTVLITKDIKLKVKEKGAVPRRSAPVREPAAFAALTPPAPPHRRGYRNRSSREPRESDTLSPSQGLATYKPEDVALRCRETKDGSDVASCKPWTQASPSDNFPVAFDAIEHRRSVRPPAGRRSASSCVFCLPSLSAPDQARAQERRGEVARRQREAPTR